MFVHVIFISTKQLRFNKTKMENIMNTIKTRTLDVIKLVACITPILLVTQVKASSFLQGFQVNKGTTSTIYSMKTLQAELNSNNVSCFTMKRKIFVSKGYKAKYGNVKEYCTAKRAKIEGITRITKDNLNSEAFKKATKAL